MEERRDRLLPMTTSPVTAPGDNPSTSETLSITAFEKDAVDASAWVTPVITYWTITQQGKEEKKDEKVSHYWEMQLSITHSLTHSVSPFPFVTHSLNFSFADSLTFSLTHMHAHKHTHTHFLPHSVTWKARMEDSIPEIDLVGAMVPTEAKSVGRIINNDDGIKFGIRQRFF